ncbi:hypothetical protein L873DRAFT_1762535 [Choiromyces venosus 120613-1]|uniref:Conserved oligomeric Golgi complex subunit 1 n=1 Tax=Choiromyces venosus 120613-1 TaxID=1336337 RepID=A0A3N4JZ54_9PEZI|nr:hypothetical protein L873DRAFT_1762535 [Choiromyces venosus 120613-1]
MAAVSPDVKSLKKWEDAFQYPIPQVRQLERQLQAELSSNKMKLRGLVGESYRDLLQTAERIIDMDASAQKVERNLAETSRNCNSRLLEKKARNLKIFEERIGAGDWEKYTFASQLAVLQNSPSVVSRLLPNNKGDSCLLATKVFVVSRLLLKSLSEQDSIPLLNSLKSQLAALRAFLLQHIDTLLSTPYLPIEQLISALTSFSLLKTSSCADVLRHFLFVRSTAISSILTESSVPSAEAILKALLLFNQTLQNAHGLFPKILSESLLQLKSQSLLQDPGLLGLAELGLDSNGQWLPEQVREFIPWVRHDDLERSRVEEQGKSWAAKELEMLNTAFEKSLQGIEDIKELVTLRGNILGLWKAGRKGRREFIQDGEKFRDLATARLTDVLSVKIDGLAAVGHELGELLKSVDGENKDYSVSLWSNSLSSMGLANGGSAFKEAVQSRVLGRDSSVKAFGKKHEEWLSSIADSATVVRGLKTPSASSAEDEDDFDAEEERIQEGTEDAVYVEKKMSESLDAAYGNLQEIVGELVERLETSEAKESEEVKATMMRASFLLRAIRQIRQNPPKRGDDSLIALSWFGTILVPRLHVLVAINVGKKSFTSVKRLLEHRKWSGKLASKTLWEGTPPLPVQPSPLVFKFLHDLVTDMHKVGDDIWTPMAVKCIKGRASKHLWQALEGVLEDREIVEATLANGSPANNVRQPKEPEPVPEHENHPEHDPETNGNVENDDNSEHPNHESEHNEEAQVNNEDSDDKPKGTSESTTEVKVDTHDDDNDDDHSRKVIGKDWAIQLLFDTLYLDEALLRKGSNAGNSGITSLAGKVESAVGTELGFDEELRRRLEGGAREYWKRTCLLFALLS